MLTDKPPRVASGRLPGHFGDPRVLALLGCLLLFRLLPRGFSNRELRQHIEQFLGVSPGQFTQGQMTYDLQRLRLHGLIDRIPRSHRYQVTDSGFRTALFLTRAYARLLRPGLAVSADEAPPIPTKLQAAINQVDRAVDRIWTQHKIAA